MKRKSLISAGVVALVLLAITITPLLAQNGNVWNVSYFNNSNWTAPPAMGMQSSYIDFNWGTVPPGPGMPSTNWTATMTSSVYFYYTGTYIFQALADDEVSLQIDGVTYINTIGAGMSGKTVQAAVPLNAGTHNLTVQYRNTPAWPTSISTGLTPTWPAATSTPRCPSPCPQHPRAATARPHADAGMRSRLVVLLPNASHQRHNRVRRLHAVHRAGPAASQLLRIRRRVGRAKNTGSIQAEPQIEVWGNCTPGALQCMHSNAIRRRCRPPAPRPAPAGSTTVPARRSISR